MFVDRTKVKLAAGKGGNGIVAWRREKYIPKGGPYGGNGGKGGAIILRADVQLPSLDWFRHRRLIRADSGKQGGPNCRQGRSGKNLVLKVPCGTLVKDAETGEVLRDLVKDQDEWVICLGGHGGRGNVSFKSPTNRAPNQCTPGKLGQERVVELELKLIADVGLVGFPNAGKSTLINAMTYTKVKIAPYPFTTLHPNLGFIQHPEGGKVLIADIPGIIEGAHNDRGLGIEFLRHIERTKMLVYVLDASGIDGRTPAKDYRVLQEEIGKYNPEMLKRPSLVLLNKADTDDAEYHIADFQQHYPLDEGVFFTSALNGDGVKTVADAILRGVMTN